MEIFERKCVKLYKKDIAGRPRSYFVPSGAHLHWRIIAMWVSVIFVFYRFPLISCTRQKFWLVPGGFFLKEIVGPAASLVFPPATVNIVCSLSFLEYFGGKRRMRNDSQPLDPSRPIGPCVSSPKRLPTMFPFFSNWAVNVNWPRQGNRSSRARLTWSPLLAFQMSSQTIECVIRHPKKLDESVHKLFN